MLILGLNRFAKPQPSGNNMQKNTNMNGRNRNATQDSPQVQILRKGTDNWRNNDQGANQSKPKDATRTSYSQMLTRNPRANQTPAPKLETWRKSSQQNIPPGRNDVEPARAQKPVNTNLPQGPKAILPFKQFNDNDLKENTIPIQVNVGDVPASNLNSQALDCSDALRKLLRISSEPQVADVQSTLPNTTPINLNDIFKISNSTAPVPGLPNSLPKPPSNWTKPADASQSDEKVQTPANSFLSFAQQQSQPQPPQPQIQQHSQPHPHPVPHPQMLPHPLSLPMPPNQQQRMPFQHHFVQQQQYNQMHPPFGNPPFHQPMPLQHQPMPPNQRHPLVQDPALLAANLAQRNGAPFFIPGGNMNFFSNPQLPPAFPHHPDAQAPIPTNFFGNQGNQRQPPMQQAVPHQGPNGPQNLSNNSKYLPGHGAFIPLQAIRKSAKPKAAAVNKQEPEAVAECSKELNQVGWRQTNLLYISTYNKQQDHYKPISLIPFRHSRK